MEYDLEGRSNKSGSIESLPNAQQKHRSYFGSPPKGEPVNSSRDHIKRGKTNRVEGMISQQDTGDLSENDSRVLRSPKVYGSVAEMKRSRIHRQRVGDTSSMTESKLHKLFSSTPDLNDNVALNTSVITLLKKDHRKSHSQEDVPSVVWNGKISVQPLDSASPLTSGGNEAWVSGVNDANTENANLPWQSIEEIYERLTLESGGINLIDDKRMSKDNLNEFGHPPPPTHPPPPPPVGQVVRVDVSRSCGEYARINLTPEVPTPTRVMSSFRPGDSAKLYASPQEVCVVGYRPSPHPVSQISRKPVSCSSVRSRSLPPNVPPPSKSSSPSSSTSSESETSGDSGGYTCSTFKRPCQQTASTLDDTSTDSGNSSEKGSHVFDSCLATSTNPYAQPVVSLRQPRPSLPLSDGEPFIPEPDYDISDEEDFASCNTIAAQPLPDGSQQRSQPPPPPPLPLPASPSVPSSQVSPFDSLNYSLQSVLSGRRPEDAMQRTAISSGEKKKPPTPPAKRKDTKENVPSGVTTYNEDYTGTSLPSPNVLNSQLASTTDHLIHKKVPTSNTPLSVSNQATVQINLTENSSEDRSEKGATEVPIVFSTLRHIERRNSSGELKKKKDPPPVAWKPPPTGSKIAKCPLPAISSSCSVASRAEVAELSNFKQIIAQKAAERQRWVSLTCDVPENAPELSKEKDSQPAPSVPKDTVVIADTSANLVSASHDCNSPHQDEDVIVNVKEQISAFEKKVESVKTSPLAVRASPSQRPDEPRKILRGSRSQVFENKVLEKANNANVKSSKSCPIDFTQDDVDDSSSGVSSDVEAHSDSLSRKEVAGADRTTPNNHETGNSKKEKEMKAAVMAEVESDDSDDASDVAWNLRVKIYEKDTMMRDDLEVSGVGRRILKKNVVSLTKLPPPIETGETDAESDVMESGLPSGEQTSNGLSDDSSSSSCQVDVSGPSKLQSAQQHLQPSTEMDSSPVVREDDEYTRKGVEDDIQYSVKLIEMHANSLQEVNVLAGLVPPPPGFDERTSDEQEIDAIAPPPEFSDDIHIPISALQHKQRQRRRQEILTRGDDDLDDSATSDLDEAEMAAKSAAAALAAAAGGIHLTCPSFTEWKASKLPPRSTSLVSSLHATSGQQHYYQHYRPAQTTSFDHHQQNSLPQTFGAQAMTKTTAKSARKMVQQRPSNAKVRLLPDLQKGVSGACNGVRVSDEMQLPDNDRSTTTDKLKMSSNSIVTTVSSCSPKEFRTKPMNQWTTKDVSDWLESLFLPEYKAKFEAAGVDGRRLSYLDDETLLKLGVKRVGHRINIEQSLRRHSTMKH